MLEKLTLVFSEMLDTLINALPNFIAGMVALVFFILIGNYIGNWFSSMLKKRWHESITGLYFGRIISWFFYLIGISIAMNILGFGNVANSVLAGAGISAIIVGFAFKDIAENFLSGLLFLVNRPFEIGNIIEISGIKGTVRGLDLRTTHLRNIEGKDIYVPNSMVIKNPVINYTKDGLLRMDFIMGLDVSTDVNAATELIIKYLDQKPEVLKHPESNVLVEDFGTCTVDVKILFWIDVFKQKNVSPSYLGQTIRSSIIKDIKDLLLKNGYSLPSYIVEHKMYEKENPLKIEWKQE